MPQVKLPRVWPLPGRGSTATSANRTPASEPHLGRRRAPSWRRRRSARPPAAATSWPSPVGRQARAALGEQQTVPALRLGIAGERGALVPVGGARAVGREAGLGRAQRIVEARDLELGLRVARLGRARARPGTRRAARRPCAYSLALASIASGAGLVARYSSTAMSRAISWAVPVRASATGAGVGSGAASPLRGRPASSRRAAASAAIRLSSWSRWNR